MALKTFKPYTKSTRGTVIVTREGIWKGKPIKSLTIGKKSTSGRNNLGRITSRRRGSGHKQKYREIDFYRKKDDMEAVVERIEYDPNRTCYIMLVKYEDGQKSYLIAPDKIKKPYNLENTEPIQLCNVWKSNKAFAKTINPFSFNGFTHHS